MSLNEVESDLNRLNVRRNSPVLNFSPRIPNSRDLFTPYYPYEPFHYYSYPQYHPDPLNGPPEQLPTPLRVTTKQGLPVSPPPGFEKLAWDLLIPKQKMKEEADLRNEGKVGQMLCGSTSNTKLQDTQGPMVDTQAKDLFDDSFLQHLSSSPSLTLNDLNTGPSVACSKFSSFTIDEHLIPIDQLLFMLNAHDKCRCISHSPFTIVD